MSICFFYDHDNLLPSDPESPLPPMTLAARGHPPHDRDRQSGLLAGGLPPRDRLGGDIILHNKGVRLKGNAVPGTDLGHVKHLRGKVES